MTHSLFIQCIFLILTAGNARPKMSNELEVLLPLEIDSIQLPPPELRQEDEDLYREYIEVREGAGYLPQQDNGE